MADDRADRRVAVSQHVDAGRDAYAAGGNLTVTNTYAGFGEPGADARLRAADELAAAVREQWQAEEGRRRIQDPVPLPVRWTVADPSLSDDSRNVFRSAAVAPGLDGSLAEAVDVFARIPSGRLVVIGQPGAGKTVFTIRFTLDLLARRQTGDPVPVIFGLHTWNPLEQDLQEWLAAQLAMDYPALRNADKSGGTVAAALVRDRLILPVLDGLDEIGQDLRGRALRTLNACLSDDFRVIVTCREADYRQIVADADVLTSAAVIELLPLGIDDLADYLPRTTKKIMSRTAPSPSTKWDPVLRRLAGQPGDPACQALLEVLCTPLMTSLARSVYSDTSADPAWLLDGGFESREEIEAHLLDEFIPAAFTTTPTPRPHRRRGPHPEDAERWLRFLARHLDRLGTRDLQWWRLPDAIPAPARWLAPGLLVITASAILAREAGKEAGNPSVIGYALLSDGPKVILGDGVSIAVGLMVGLSIITAKLPTPGQGKVSARFRAMGRRLSYASLAALPVGFAMAFILTRDPGDLFGSGSRHVASLETCMLLLGLAAGVVLGAAGIDARQAPTTTPLRLRRRLRLVSRRLLRDAGLGLLTGIIVSLALWIAWGIGFAAATEVQIATAPAFPAGGSVHQLPGGAAYAVYPGGIKLTIAADGDLYAQQGGPSDGFAGTIHSQFVAGFWSGAAPSICKKLQLQYPPLSCSETYVYQTTNSLIRIYPDPGGINDVFMDYDFQLAVNSPLPLGSLISWAYRPNILQALSEEANESIESAVAIGLIGSVIGALFLWLEFPADVARAISPLSTLRADRNAAIFRGGVMLLLVDAVPLYILVMQFRGLQPSYDGVTWIILVRDIAPIVLVLGVGLLALTLSTWARLQVARTWLAARGKLPWRLMRFLEDAHARGALRQAGASYQFRHVRLQERLAASPRDRDHDPVIRRREVGRDPVGLPREARHRRHARRHLADGSSLRH